MEIINSISTKLISGDDKGAASDTKKALDSGVPAETILNDGLIMGMNIVGDRFRDHEIFLPDVLMAARAMYAGMELIKPILIKSGISSRGKVVIGTIQGDLHDIGKNLVGIMLKGAGYEVIDLGHDVSPEKFVEAAKETGATIIGMSALLTTTMANMKEVVEILKSENLHGKIRTIIGGAPISEQYASEIGADKYSFDAGNAVDTVKELLEK